MGGPKWLTEAREEERRSPTLPFPLPSFFSPPPLPPARTGGGTTGPRLGEGAGLPWVFEFQMRVTIKQLAAVSPGFKLSLVKARTLVPGLSLKRLTPRRGVLCFRIFIWDQGILPRTLLSDGL